MPTEGRKLYLLLNTQEYSSCSQKVSAGYFDTRYDKIGSISEDRLFRDNGKFPPLTAYLGVFYVIQNLPQYPLQETSRYSWNLYSNEYNYWDVQCEMDKNIDRSAMLSLLEDAVSVSRLV